MIGITLVTAISTVFSSLSVSVGKVVDQELHADLIVAGQQTSEIPPTIETSALDQIRRVPEMDTVAAVTYDQATVNGKRTFMMSYDDWAAARRVLETKAKSGSIETLNPGQVIVDERTAKDAKVHAGDQIRIQLPKGGERTATVVGITTETNVNNGFILPIEDARQGFRSAQPIQAYAKLKTGASIGAAKKQVESILSDSAEVTVSTRAEYVNNNSTKTFDFILNAVQVLLLVAMAISVLGVINTLVLSVIERTRELGMLRAIGLRRSQTMRMITVESVVISLFGTLLGLALGAGLGAAIVVALKDAIGFGEVSLPWTLMITYLVASLFVGVLAAVLPAIRAARLNVLGAIAYE
jgi:putative ABC transport system permease protein